jgi:phosphatidylethanolamine-binding protein (PEBP) family uncharacterized protein
MIQKILTLSIGVFFFVSACKKDESIDTLQPSTSTFKLTSAAVANGLLLDTYKCEKKVNKIESSIPLAWSGAPANAKAFAVTMTHYPNPNDLTNISSYLVLWGIDKAVTEIPYGKGNGGPWFIGPNKDLVNISYSSPCSAGSGTHQYTITIYALSETPASLPKESSLNVTYQVLTKALSTVTVIDKTTLIFNSVTL